MSFYEYASSSGVEVDSMVCHHLKLKYEFGIYFDIEVLELVCLLYSR
jgi:hypothetical protein